jgi:hypothetical protein
MPRRLLILFVCLCLPALLTPRMVLAQAGPPYITNDPGTPGNANWEINIAEMTTSQRGVDSYQVPQIDMNFGVGERIQLTCEVPYVVQTADGRPSASAWSNALPGVKWRFFDQGEGGWQISTFPQFETRASAYAQRTGIAEDGPRLLLPMEFARAVGTLDLDFEAGYYFPWHGHGNEERILGLVAGHTFSPRLELDAELYNDHGMGGVPPDFTTLDLGGRYKLHRGFILLFMAGRSIAGPAATQVDFIGYIGIQILLSNYGRTLSTEP